MLGSPRLGDAPHQANSHLTCRISPLWRHEANIAGATFPALKTSSEGRATNSLPINHHWAQLRWQVLVTPQERLTKRQDGVLLCQGTPSKEGSRKIQMVSQSASLSLLPPPALPHFPCKKTELAPKSHLDEYKLLKVSRSPWNYSK